MHCLRLIYKIQRKRSVNIFLYFSPVWTMSADSDNTMRVAHIKPLRIFVFSWQEEEQKAVSHPSLLSHITSSFLNHPVFPMTEKVPVPTLQLLAEFSPLMSPLPCDIHLVNLRTIQSKVYSQVYLWKADFLYYTWYEGMGIRKLWILLCFREWLRVLHL